MSRRSSTSGTGPPPAGSSTSAPDGDEISVPPPHHLLTHSSIQTDSKQGATRARQITAATLAALIAHRIIQRWNQTGQKHAGAPDIVTSYLLHHPLALWALVAQAYLAAGARLAQDLAAHLGVALPVAIFGAALAVAPAAAFKAAFTAADSPELFFWLQGETLEALETLPLVAVARGVFATLGVLAVLLLVGERKGSRAPGSGFLNGFHSLLTLFLMTQTRAHNIPLFLLFTRQHFSLASLRLTPVQIAITAMVLGQASFFGLGNSNAMSSIDLSSAYNGVSGYSVGAVGALVFAGNWAGPIWWGVAALVLMAEERTRVARPVEKSRQDWVEEEHENLAASSTVDAVPVVELEGTSPWADYFAIATLYVAGSLLAVMGACLALRTHLFIWTVFSPKYLYSMAWSLGYHYLVSLGLCGGLWSLQRA
jgi:ethanolaminephosphotransferase